MAAAASRSTEASRVPHAIGIGLTICHAPLVLRVVRSDSTATHGTRSPTCTRCPGTAVTSRATSA